MASETPVRILFLMDCLYDDAEGGSERQFLGFYQSCPDFGIEIHVCFLRHQPVHDQIAWMRPPIYLNIHRPFSLAAFRAARKLANYIKEYDIELVQTLFDDAAIFSGLLYALYLRGRPPLVIGLRNSGHAHRGFRRWLLRPAYSQANHFIVNAKMIAAHLNQKFDVDPLRISVIRNVYIPRKHGKNNCAQELADELQDRFNTIAIIVANLRPVKGIDDLLRAIALLRRPDVGFLFVGGGENVLDYHQLADELGITSQIIFLGRRDDIIELLDIANFALLPSRSEGLSNALIEYLLAGLPVIATNVGGNAEVVTDGRNGLLVPPCDAVALVSAIRQLIEDISCFRARALQERNIAAGRYSLPVIMKQYRTKYLELCR